MKNEGAIRRRVTAFLKAHDHCEIAIISDGDVLIGINDELQEINDLGVDQASLLAEHHFKSWRVHEAVRLATDESLRQHRQDAKLWDTVEDIEKAEDELLRSLPDGPTDD